MNKNYMKIDKTTTINNFPTKYTTIVLNCENVKFVIGGVEMNLAVKTHIDQFNKIIINGIVFERKDNENE